MSNYFENNKKILSLNNKQALVLDDVLLVPKKGILNSRNEAVISKKCIYTAPMDTVTDLYIYKESIKTNLVKPVLARVYLSNFFEEVSILDSIDRVHLLENGFISIGSKIEDFIYLKNKLNEYYTDLDALIVNIAIDIAHGFSNFGLEQIKRIKEEIPHANIMSGSICTFEGAEAVIKAGATHIRCGLGSGSMCTTRLMTGCGYPNLTAIFDIYQNCYNKYPDITLIADGGIKYPGDVVKYLAAGANAAMVGTVFASCSDSPAPIVDGNKLQRGQASYSYQIDYKGEVSNNCPEGITKLLPLGVDFIKKVKEYEGGIKSAISYLGLKRISDINPKNCEFIKVSNNSLYETHPI